MSKAPAVDYALQIIEYISRENKPVGIADISNALDINKNATSRILGALIENGWIYCSDEIQKKYLFTMKPFSLVSRCVKDSTLVKVAEPFLRKLNEELGDATYLGIKKDKSVLYLLHYDSTHSVRINGSVGCEYPMHVSAPGKILLAHSSKDEMERYFEGEKTKFYAEAEEIRKNDFAIDNEEFAKGIICYAAPVYDHFGDVIASVGISSLTIYDDIPSLCEKGKLVSECARAISVGLGYVQKV